MKLKYKNVVGVMVAKGPTITLQSGSQFDLLDPWNSEFTIEDIAHGLSHICRYAGHCNAFYSVAEHSIIMSHLLPGRDLEALMHDSAEAFLGDVTRPLKLLLPDYKRIEKDVEDAIHARFGIARGCRDDIKAVDIQVLAAEQAQIMPPGTDAWVKEAGIVPAAIHVRHLSPMDAREAFLARYRTLRGG